MSGYRQRRDPREIAVELYGEAMDRHTQALKDKHAAEAALAEREHEHEIWLAKNGAHASTLRHLSALLKSAEQVGPPVADVSGLESQLAQARAAMSAAGVEIVEAEKRIDAAREVLGRAVEALAAAAREVAARRAELERA
ncbi:MAG: hypothetical protein HYZ29_23905 [Myxococcales bacterium]|nr:hypothetical protein [Myxococcales bacterium]